MRAFGELINLLSSEITVELQDNAQLEDLVSKLVEKTKSFNEGFIGLYNVVENLTVLVNGRNMSALNDSFSLKDGDVVTLLPPFVGG